MIYFLRIFVIFNFCSPDQRIALSYPCKNKLAANQTATMKSTLLRSITGLISLSCFAFQAFSQTWEPQVSGTGGILSEVTFINDSIGWVVGTGGTILHTTNGGHNWQTQVSGTSEWLRAIDMLSETEAGSLGTMERSSIRLTVEITGHHFQ